MNLRGPRGVQKVGTRGSDDKYCGDAGELYSGQS